VATAAQKAPTPVVLASKPIPTPAVLLAMLGVSSKVSDLILSPGSFPMVELSGKLTPVKIPGMPPLTPDDTRRIAYELIEDNKQATDSLQNLGSCDISYRVPGRCRFRVNIFQQRGSHAIVMRVIPQVIPTLADLKLPPQLSEIADLQNGIVLVTGPTGSGKSSTLAAVLDRINESHAYHILTIEDPIEFMHRHKCSIVHQRELHSDTPSFALALRAALRQAPKVILVGEMRDKEGAFPMGEQHTIRNRLGKSFRAIISQRLIPRKDGNGRVAIVEILKSTLRTREYIEKGEQDGKTLLEAMTDGDTDGMQHFDGEIEKLVRVGVIDLTTGLAYATNPGNLRLLLTDMGSAATE
jgi:twitching motility protein PilT